MGSMILELGNVSNQFCLSACRGWIATVLLCGRGMNSLMRATHVCPEKEQLPYD